MSAPIQLAFSAEPEPAEIVCVLTSGHLLKIGRSQRHVRHRGGEMKADPLFALMGTRELESELHKRFKAYRIGRSEWFKPEGELLLWVIATVRQQGGRKAWALLCETMYSYFSAPDAVAGAYAVTAAHPLVALGCYMQVDSAELDGPWSDVLRNPGPTLAVLRTLIEEEMIPDTPSVWPCGAILAAG